MINHSEHDPSRNKKQVFKEIILIPYQPGDQIKPKTHLPGEAHIATSKWFA